MGRHGRAHGTSTTTIPHGRRPVDILVVTVVVTVSITAISLARPTVTSRCVPSGISAIHRHAARPAASRSSEVEHVDVAGLGARPFAGSLTSCSVAVRRQLTILWTALTPRRSGDRTSSGRSRWWRCRFGHRGRRESRARSVDVYARPQGDDIVNAQPEPPAVASAYARRTCDGRDGGAVRTV